MVRATALVLIVLLAPTDIYAQEVPAKFQEVVGQWTIAGDPDAGGCVMYQRQSSKRTTMIISSRPQQHTFRVSLSNMAWKTIESGSLNLGASYHGSNGSIKDYWKLSAVGQSSEDGGPRVFFDTKRAKNDQASFLDHFQQWQSLSFWLGEVPIAHFSLQASSKAISSLYKCRTMLRIDEDFDPFVR